MRLPCPFSPPLPLRPSRADASVSLTSDCNAFRVPGDTAPPTSRDRSIEPKAHEPEPPQRARPPPAAAGPVRFPLPGRRDRGAGTPRIFFRSLRSPLRTAPPPPSAAPARRQVASGPPPPAPLPPTPLRTHRARPPAPLGLAPGVPTEARRATREGLFPCVRLARLGVRSACLSSSFGGGLLCDRASSCASPRLPHGAHRRRAAAGRAVAARRRGRLWLRRADHPGARAALARGRRSFRAASFGSRASSERPSFGNRRGGRASPAGAGRRPAGGRARRVHRRSGAPSGERGAEGEGGEGGEGRDRSESRQEARRRARSVSAGAGRRALTRAPRTIRATRRCSSPMG